MSKRLTRRRFLEASAGVGIMCMTRTSAGQATAAEAPPVLPKDLPFPVVDLHVHLDNSTIDQVLPLAAERGVKFGIVEHAGTKENVYPVVLSNDAELEAHLTMLEGKPVYKGVQAEWTDWMGCFSKQTLSKLDYVLTDAMTFPDKDGRRMKLWEKGADIGDPKTFMDRYVDWHVEIMANEPIDILANVSWLPAEFAADYDTLWTESRVSRVAEAALKYGVAIEISSGFRLPKLPFLRLVKAAGVKFTFGSNGRYPNMGKLDYSIRLAKELALTANDMFTPAPDGQKAVQRRMKG